MPGLRLLRAQILAAQPASFQTQYQTCLPESAHAPALAAWLERQLVLDHPAPEHALARLECLHRLHQIRASFGQLTAPVFAPSPFRHSCVPALLRYLAQQMDYLGWHGLSPDALAVRSRAFEAALFALAGRTPQDRHPDQPQDDTRPAAGLPLAQARALLRAGWTRHFGLDTELQPLSRPRLEAALAQGLPVCVLGHDGLDIPDAPPALHASLILPPTPDAAHGPDGQQASKQASSLLLHFDPLQAREISVSMDALLTHLGPQALILLPSLPCPPCA
jgi:hypothetical protein